MEEEKVEMRKEIPLLGEIGMADSINEEEKEDCPICLSSLSEMKYNSLQIFLCCGKVLCEECGEKLLRLGDQLCPMCRTKLFSSSKEKFELTLKHASMHKLWALNNVANCYFEGDGCTRDVVKAVYYYKIAAKKGKKEAIANLAYCYLVGEGVAKSSEKAFEYFKISANKGYPQAMVQVGNCYFNGIGVEKSIPFGVKWYETAISYDESNAMFILGCAYSNGIEVEKDERKGLELLVMAASFSHFEACFELGLLCLKERKEVLAFHWFNLFLKGLKEEELDAEKVKEAHEILKAISDTAKKHCGFCKSSIAKEMKCNGCHFLTYCGKKCQIDHWKEHKIECLQGFLNVIV